jgi:uncharacterized repeat protein (TIGR01451 family)
MFLRCNSKLILSTIFLLSFFPFLTSLNVYAGTRTFAPRFSANVNGNIAIIGNSVLTCPISNAACASARNRTGSAVNNNNYSMVYTDIDNNTSTFSSSSANLSLPAGSQVLWAGLYWSGIENIPQRLSVKLDTPAFGGYIDLSSTLDDYNGSVRASRVEYQEFVDVTTLVQAGGSGTYTVGNVASRNVTGSHGGWSIAVAYSNPNEVPRNLTVFDGFLTIPLGSSNIPVSGFLTPPIGQVRATVSVVAYEGDAGSNGDGFAFNGTTISNAANPSDNFFNSTISNQGVTVNNRNPDFANTFGFDIDMVNVDGLLGNNVSSTNLTFKTSGDFYFTGVVTSAIEIYQPVINLNKTAQDLNGGTVVSGDIIEYTITATNGGRDVSNNTFLKDVISPNATYIPGSMTIDNVSRTDAGGDDQAGFVNNEVNFRLGNGANVNTGGNLNINQSSTVKFRVRVNNNLPDNTQINNTATSTYRSNLLNTNYSTSSNPVSLTVVIPRADLSLTKVSCGFLIAGSTCDYILTVTNNGPTAVTPITVTDNLPPRLTYIGFQNPIGSSGWICSAAERIVTCTNNGTLPAGATSSFIIKTRLPAL